MNSNDRIEKLIRDMRCKPGPEAHDRVLGKAYGAMDEAQKREPEIVRRREWRTRMNSRTTKALAVAAAILIVLGGVTLWPNGHSTRDQWWNGPSSAWGQEILNSLGKVEAVVYRQRSGLMSDFGAPEMSIGWERRYNAQDCYRRDRYDDGVTIMNTQWVIRDGNTLSMVEVSHEYKCYFTQENQRYGFVEHEDMLERMRFYVGLSEKADRPLGTEIFDGRECVGFEISAAKYGDNPQGRFDRIWFDVETRLPARIESHGIPMSGGQTLVIIHDQFEYHAQVPADLFTPVIPDGYIRATPDEVRAARDAAVKGPMVFAQVPPGVKEKVVSALKQATTGAWYEGQTHIFFSKDSWRIEDRNEAGLQKITWYRVDNPSVEGLFEVSGSVPVTRTTLVLDHERRTVSAASEGSGDSQPRHPMQGLLFLAGLIGQADRFYDNIQIDGVTCFGFEISAKKYGDNPDGMLDRLWFDATTNLPVKIEFVSPRSDGTRVNGTGKDRFEWNLMLPDDFFEPKPPAGFTLVKP
jgi:outer membrane lipoprotein-sorting protein